MPQSPEQVTVNDVIDALYAIGKPVVMPDTPTDADMPSLIGALLYAADSLQVHKVLLSEQDVQAMVDGWLTAAGARDQATQALAIATMRAGMTAALMRTFTAEGALHRSMAAAAQGAHRMMAAAGIIALARRGPHGDDQQIRGLLRGARADLRDAVQAYEALRKELRALGHDI